MLLREMFSPIGAPKDEQQEIDWIDDLKFFFIAGILILVFNYFIII